MSFVKPSAIGLKIVEGRKGNTDMANMACLGSNLMKEWGNIGAARSGGECFTELEAFIRIEYYIGFVVYPVINTEKDWT